jgi:phosphoglucosamine mutase
MVASSWQKSKRLTGGGVVATVMSNLGFERYLGGIGLHLARTQVGDRYVVEKMREGGYNVGGEQSGHIILADYATTGDGLIAALEVLACVVQSGRPVSECGRMFAPYPQVLKSVRFNGGAPLEDGKVTRTIEGWAEKLGDKGRLVIRKSGTEPVIRVMAEGEDKAMIDTVVADICAAIERAAHA